MSDPQHPGAPAGGHAPPDLLPSAVDPTVFDEAFLRQLERLMLVTRKAVQGGMKGVRRSPKRGQSVEFTDYRDYTPGDDLRSLDWNVYARLEKLFIKLFVEEEDVNVHVLLDASASMHHGAPDKLLFARRAAAALAYVGLASYDRVSLAVLHTLSPDELDPPLEGDLRLVDRETGAGVEVTADLVALDDYRARLARWQADLESHCTKRRVAYVPVPTTLPLSDLVFAELRRRRVVA